MPMTAEEYLERRVEDQIGWYDRKSVSSQAWYKRLRRAEIVCAAAIPILAGFVGEDLAGQVAIGLLGGVIVVIASFLSLSQHQENWVGYRTTCESLRHEKFLFLTQVEPYDGEDRFPLFVQRIESLISKENSGWSQYIRAEGKETGDREGGGAAPADHIAS